MAERLPGHYIRDRLAKGMGFRFPIGLALEQHPADNGLTQFTLHTEPTAAEDAFDGPAENALPAAAPPDSEPSPTMDIS